VPRGVVFIYTIYIYIVLDGVDLFLSRVLVPGSPFFEVGLLNLSIIEVVYLPPQLLVDVKYFPIISFNLTLMSEEVLTLNYLFNYNVYLNLLLQQLLEPPNFVVEELQLYFDELVLLLVLEVELGAPEVQFLNCEVLLLLEVVVSVTQGLELLAVVVELLLQLVGRMGVLFLLAELELLIGVVVLLEFI
jgi:hypothetical protein